MLQVRDLTKRYTTKGETVGALDHVSVDFPEKGMVFLLGKSGSGKSTLLNLAGGLDVPDEGEIIVKGKSSKDFSQSDFDSYRNTYVGFIFQEYNILNELTVGENVALALELQGKPRDKQRIDELLSMVDMQGYADRKPNTLSGGQKQRVAIARALVKEHEIIMADEPTGALDSATGSQVFDTLKKLSREKLVVVVSHDREFAEMYADRIIELQDGRVISDVSRSGEACREINVMEAGPKKLTVMSGAAMTKQDEERVIAFLRANKGGVVLSAEKEDLPAAGGAESVGTFAPTNAAPAPREENTASFLPSRFPARYAFKMGISGLKFKPLRLIVTTLLASVAFIVFGVFSTMLTYSPAQMGVSGLLNSSYGAAVLQKKMLVHTENDLGPYTITSPSGTLGTRFVSEEVEEIREKTGINFIPVYNFGRQVFSLSYSYSFEGANYFTPSDYYDSITSLTGFASVSYIMDDDDYTLLAGEYPAEGREILISRQVFESFVQFGYRPTAALEPAAVQQIETYDDLIGKSISLRVTAGMSLTFTVTGIFDPGEEFEEFSKLKTGEGFAPGEETEMIDGLKECFRYSMSSVAFVADSYYASQAGSALDFNESDYHSLLYSIEAIRREGNDAESNYTEESASQERYQFLMTSLRSDPQEKTDALFEYFGLVDDVRDISYYLPYSYLNELNAGQEIYTLIFPIIGAAAGVLAVFAALLLFSFISASINAKKKDIGILRAVGARSIDVFKIFIVEGAVVTFLCLLLGIAGSIAACAVTNGILIAENILTYNFFLFDWKNALILLGIAAGTAFVATGIPVAVFSKKKPVETIRSI